jgi:hypothetical protein
MAVVNPVAFLQAGSYPALSDRLHLTSCRFLPTASSSTAMTARGGFLQGQPGRLASFSMVAWDVTIGPFASVVENTFAAQAGEYIALNTANAIVTVTASSPTTNRIDIVGVRVQDAFYSGALNQGDIVIVQGTPSAGAPSAPALPLSFLPIVQVTVSAATSTGVLTDLRKRTSVTGAAYQPYPPQLTDNGTVTGEVQLMPAAGVYPARLRVWDGSAWRGVTPFQFALPSVTANASIAVSAQHIISSLSVADPGFSYKLHVQGSADWAMVNGAVPDHPISLSTTVDQTQYDLGVISRGNSWSANTAGTVPQPTALAPLSTTGVLTGAHTVRLIARNSSGSQAEQIRPLDALFTTGLAVLLVPA